MFDTCISFPFIPFHPTQESLCKICTSKGINPPHRSTLQTSENDTTYNQRLQNHATQISPTILSSKLETLSTSAKGRPLLRPHT